MNTRALFVCVYEERDPWLEFFHTHTRDSNDWNIPNYDEGESIKLIPQVINQSWKRRGRERRKGKKGGGGEKKKRSEELRKRIERGKK